MKGRISFNLIIICLIGKRSKNITRKWPSCISKIGWSLMSFANPKKMHPNVSNTFYMFSQTFPPLSHITSLCYDDMYGHRHPIVHNFWPKKINLPPNQCSPIGKMNLTSWFEKYIYNKRFGLDPPKPLYLQPNLKHPNLQNELNLQGWRFGNNA